jgi:hypothetical protein
MRTRNPIEIVWSNNAVGHNPNLARPTDTRAAAPAALGERFAIPPRGAASAAPLRDTDGQAQLKPRAISSLLGLASRLECDEAMRRQAVVFYVLALIAVVVGVDVLFLRHDFWPRLIANVGIVLVFGVFYLRFLRRR